jgi:uncharacterized protein YllA (UPF0747 family)
VYQAQLRRVYQRFGIAAPLLHPRLSATIADTATLRFWARHGLSLDRVQMSEDALVQALVERRLPADFDAVFDDVLTHVASQLERVRPLVAHIDPTLSGAVDTTTTRASDPIATLRRKALQAARQRDDTLRRQVKRTQSLVFPQGEPQERALSGVYFLNRHGPALIERLGQLDPFQVGYHHVVGM